MYTPSSHSISSLARNKATNAAKNVNRTHSRIKRKRTSRRLSQVGFLNSGLLHKILSLAGEIRALLFPAVYMHEQERLTEAGRDSVSITPRLQGGEEATRVNGCGAVFSILVCVCVCVCHHIILKWKMDFLYIFQGGHLSGEEDRVSPILRPR